MEFLFIIIFIFGITLSMRRAARRRFWGYSSYDGIWENSWRPSRSNRYISNAQKKENRRIAIQKASSFLKPFTNMMGELCLVNDNCRVNLAIDKNGEKKIICMSKIPTKNGKRMLLTARVNLNFPQYYNVPLDYVIDNLWDSICMSFDYSTMYENISLVTINAMLDINEVSIEGSKNNNNVQNNTQTSKNLLNINKASEAELLALPGVNIVLAKKAIKYIQKNNGFKSVDEFIKKMKIKDTFAEQIKSVTYIAPVSKEILNEETEPQQIDINNNKLEIMEDNSISQQSDNERIIDI